MTLLESRVKVGVPKRPDTPPPMRPNARASAPGARRSELASRLHSLDLHRQIQIRGITDRIKLRDVAVITRQLAIMVGAGLSLIRALGILEGQLGETPLRDVVVAVRGDIERGSALSEALARHPKAFDRFYVSMVRAGEIGGQLDDVLANLATSMERRVSLRAKLRSAAAYPAVMGLVAVAVVAAMMIFVVPTFTRLYGQFHGKLPMPTHLVVDVSHFVVSPWVLLLLAVIAGTVLGVRRAIRDEDGRRVLDGLLLKLPVVGDLILKLGLERMASVLGSLLDAGVPIVEALDLAAANANTVQLSDAARYASAGVREGRPLAATLSDCPVVPPMLCQLVETGEESGSVGELLGRVAGFYREEIDTTVNGLTSLLEPVMVVVMGIVIGSIVVSLYLPMLHYITLVNTVR